jgi:SH3 domain protein
MFFVLPSSVTAETVYIDDKVMIGLHQDQDIDSAIIKLLPGGGALEVLKRDTEFTQVKEPGGASGWIDNRYLVDAAPGTAEVQQAQEKIARLEADLSALKQGQKTTAAFATGNQKLDALSKENEQLKQQLQSEQLKAGEFQAQAAELRNQLDRGDAGARDGAANDSSDSDQASGPGSGSGNSGWFTGLIGIVCIIIGLIGGACYMDWYSRRKHGGFRIW